MPDLIRPAGDEARPASDDVRPASDDARPATDGSQPANPCGTARLAPLAMLAALITATALSACGDRASQDGERAVALSTTVDTVGGVVHVRNAGTASQWELVPVVSIGPADVSLEQGPAEFGEVISIALDPSGEAVYVADRLHCEIRVFDLDGAHLRTFGRCGEGPGELTEYFFSIARVGDKLLALDFGNGRIGEFSAAGEWLGQRRIRAGMGGGAQQRLHPVGWNEAYAFQFAQGDLGPLYAGHDEAGLTPDTVPAALSQRGLIICEYNEGWVSSFTVPFVSVPVQHPGPGGLRYSATTGEYRVAVTRGDDTLRIIERDLPAEAISDEEWDAGNQEFREFREEMPGAGASCEPGRPERPIAKPFINEIWVAPDGRLWVEVVRTAGNRWEVFDADGVLLGQAPAQARRESIGSDTRLPPTFAPGLMATARQDSLDLDHVDVFRIEERR